VTSRLSRRVLLPRSAQSWEGDLFIAGDSPLDEQQIGRPSSTVTLLTGANVSATRHAKMRREKLSITAWR
jgi:hypothetical protein